MAEVLFDDAGTADIEAILGPLANTEFEYANLRQILGTAEVNEDWRVGEAIAEAYLSGHRGCYFPWPDGRDERKSGSSLPGADLVGFGNDEDGDCFAFGEVKTSSDVRCPPQAMYGRTGLKRQLEDLRDQISIRSTLVKYLAFRAISAPWCARFQSASKRYIKNNSDVQVFGVLVRDVAPSEADLRKRVADLGQNCPCGTKIELLAIYLPIGRIHGIAAATVSKRTGGKK